MLEPVPLETLLSDLRGLVGAARARAAANINSELVMLYWTMGRRIHRDILEDVRGEYGRGYSRSTLFRMLQFAALYPDQTIVSTLSRQLSWSHFIEFSCERRTER